MHHRCLIWRLNASRNYGIRHLQWRKLKVGATMATKNAGWLYTKLPDENGKAPATEIFERRDFGVLPTLGKKARRGTILLATADTWVKAPSHPRWMLGMKMTAM